MSELQNTIPDHWLEVKLEEVLIRISNGTTAKQNKEEIGLPVTRIETISKETVDLERVRHIANPSPEFISKYKLEKGDILFSHINSDLHLGKTAIFNLDQTVLHGMNLLLIRSNSDVIYPDYLNYLFKFFRHSGNFISIAQHAVNQSSINQRKMKQLKIQLAPYNEQIRIICRVEELFSLLDAGVRSLQAAQTQLEQYRQSTLKQAFTGKLTQKWRQKHENEINYFSKVLDKFKLEKTEHKVKQLIEQDAHWIVPDSWKWTPFKTIADINPKLPYELDDKVDVSFIPMKHVEKESGKIDFTEIRKYGEVKKGYTKFIDNDIIFAKITPCMENGKIAIPRGLSNGVGVGSTEFHVIRMKDDSLLNQFYYYFLLQKWFRNLAGQHFTGTVGHRRVPTDFMKEVMVPLTPFREQVCIVEIIEECFSFINLTEINIENSFKKIIGLKQSILKKAFQGHLVPQDPSDEPASVLLERIKAQKIKQRKMK